jgi:formate hydrogenlyase subunit 3/multisubunit Na+/H+ antiporter MnhD subunit
MAKKKKKEDTMSGLALGTITGTIAIGSIPTMTGFAAETNIKTSAVSGYENVARTFPTMGSIKGTTGVLGALGTLKKKSKKLI